MTISSTFCEEIIYIYTFYFKIGIKGCFSFYLGVKGRAIKEKKTFFGTFFPKVPTARRLREEFFLRLPLLRPFKENHLHL